MCASSVPCAPCLAPIVAGLSWLALRGAPAVPQAVEIFHAALTSRHYTCFLAPDTRLPFLYMPDCLAATYQLLTADSQTLTQASL